MASDETNSKPRRFGIGRFWRRDEETPDAPSGEADAIVDSAEAFKSLRVADVMTPRADIVAVELTAPFSDLLARFLEAEHSRMPVYRDTPDDPVGVIHVKDVFKLIAGGRRPAPDTKVIDGLMREVMTVPPSMPASALLTRMKAGRSHMAMVIDEFGGVDGLVTLEDLIEAVVGDIEDEHDETVGPSVLSRGAGVFEADARATLEDLESLIGADLTDEAMDGEIDTVGGLVVALAGRVPQRGEVIPHERGWEFEVLDADPRRVRRVRVRELPPAETPSEA